MPTLYYLDRAENDEDAAKGIKTRRWFASKLDRDHTMSIMLYAGNGTPYPLDIGEIYIPPLTKQVVIDILTKYGSPKVHAKQGIPRVLASQLAR